MNDSSWSLLFSISPSSCPASLLLFFFSHTCDGGWCLVMIRALETFGSRMKKWKVWQPHLQRLVLPGLVRPLCAACLWWPWRLVSSCLQDHHTSHAAWIPDFQSHFTFAAWKLNWWGSLKQDLFLSAFLVAVRDYFCFLNFQSLLFNLCV